MSVDNKAIIERMQIAGIPPTAYKTTLAREGQATLSHIIKNRDFEADGAPRSFLVCHNGHGPRRSAQIAALAAKELVLMGQRVRYLPLARILRELRLSEKAHDSLEINFTKQGSGFIVVPDFDHGPSVPNDWEMENVKAWLLEHVARGGGLVLAYNLISRPGRGGDSVETSPAFGALLSGFTTCLVELQHV